MKIFLDTADINLIQKFKNKKNISGFTTNPTLVAKSKVKNYIKFCRKLSVITHKPISLEVFSDNFKKMEKEAIFLNNIGKNVFVKIPVVNSKGRSTHKLIKNLLEKGVKVNITAIFTIKQIKILSQIINKRSNVILSIFCGRIMDSGVYPNKISKFAKKIFANYKNVFLLWASTRELFNIVQAKKLNFDIITITPEIYKKMKFLGYDLNKFSKETVKMFLNDAKKSKLKII